MKMASKKKDYLKNEDELKNKGKKCFGMLDSVLKQYSKPMIPFKVANGSLGLEIRTIPSWFGSVTRNLNYILHFPYYTLHLIHCILHIASDTLNKSLKP